MRTGRFFLTAALTLALCCAPPPGGVCAEGWQDGVYRDVAPGFHDDEVIVTVVVRDGKLAELRAENKSGEESEYFRKAEAGLSAAIVEKQGIEGVDAVSGATGTSQSILAAMEGILAQASYAGSGGASADGSPAQGASPAPTPRPTLDPAKAEVFAGLGGAANFRAGPGKDDTGTPVYSFNVTMASALFDKDGRILDVQVDVYEVATPNYDGESMPHFSGWPGKEGYNVYSREAGKVGGVSQNTEESARQEIADWKTKRERGDRYGMNPQNEWYQQMDHYEQWMIGKTVSEVRGWFARYTSERNGRPIQENSGNPDDQKVYAKLTDEEKAQLYDVVSMATMSLSDDHGLLLEAIEKAYDHRTPVEGVKLD